MQQAAPQALKAGEAASLLLDPDKNLDAAIIRHHGFKLPSELNLSDQSAIVELREQITKLNVYTLGAQKKRKDSSEAKKASLSAEIKALAEYRERLDLLSAGHKLTSASGKQQSELKRGTGLKLRGNRSGVLTIDPAMLAAGQVQAFQGGNLVLEAPADESLHNLLTKRFVKTKQYTPQAIETFTRLVSLAGLPLHGRKSSKHQLIRGGAVSIQLYNDPNVLVERLTLLVASKKAGNTGVDNEISAILDELMRSGKITKDLALQLNGALL